MYVEPKRQLAGSVQSKGALSLPQLSKDDVTIVLPVLNEEDGIGAVIDELVGNGFEKILVVDGYSTDSTVQVARDKGVTVIQQHGAGKTGAIKTAIEHISTPYLLIMDGDFTYRAEDIQRFLGHVEHYDEIVGIRSRGNINPVHRFGNRIISSFFNALFESSISDVCSGMYMLDSNSARNLSIRTKGFSVEVEILAQMTMEGRITQIPIGYRQRIGEPKLSTLVHGFDILRSIVGLARVYNPIFLLSLAAAFAAVPGLAIMLWVLWVWLQTGIFHSGWALGGAILLVVASEAFIVGTLALLLKRTELRIERLLGRSTKRTEP